MRRMINTGVRLAVALLVALAVLAPRAWAQPYPVNNPTYIPSAVLPSTAVIPTGQGSSYVFQTNGQGTLYMRIAGAPTGLVANLQGTEGRNPLSIAATVTITNASPGVVTWTNHNLSVNQPVVFTTTGGLPTGLTAGTTYYVIAAGLTSGAFEVAATPGGAAINTSSAGSGTHTGTSTSVEWTSLVADVLGSSIGMPRVNTIANTGLYKVNVAGMAQVRLNVASLTSGVVYADFSAGPGSELVRTTPMVRATYRAAASIGTGATTNFFVLPGSATRTVFVSRTACSGRSTAVTGPVVGINVEVHSAADSGDAGTAVAAVPLDSNFPVGTTAPVFHTTSPTPGTVVGSVAQGQLGIVLNTSTATDFPQPNVLQWEFGNRPGTLPLILRGVAQSLSLSTSAVFGAGAAVTCEIEWQED